MGQHPVLILSGIYDFSSDEICLGLKERNIPYLRLNLEQMSDFTFELHPQKRQLIIDGLDINGKFSDFRSIYYRQPIFYRNTPDVPLTLEEQLSKSQWLAFIRALQIFDDILWVNNPQAIYLAESKPYQLYVADKIGLSTPITRIVNKNINIFSENKFIVKSLDTILLKDGEDCLFTYTTVTDSEELSQHHLTSAPFIVQEFLAEKIDIRVTIINRTIYAHKILSHGYGIYGDWRKTKKERLEYIEIDLDTNLKHTLIELNRQLNLTYSAIDLCEYKSKMFFLEVNPTGEWGFLTKSTPRISQTIIDELIK